MDPVVAAPEPARLQGVRVSFEPGARTAWAHHTRSARRFMCCRASGGRRHGADRCARSGPATRSGSRPARSTGTGAAPETGMTHLALQESLDGTHVEWMEHVPDEVYTAEPES